MNRKPDKVEETAAPYIVGRQEVKPVVSKTAKNEKRTVDAATFKKVADKIFSERKELLHKLAQ